MKKTVVEFEFDPEYRKMLEMHMPEAIESMELLDMIRMDLEKGVKVAITKIRMKEGYTLSDLRLPEGSEVLSVLTANGSEYVCLVKGRQAMEMFGMGAGFMENFNLDIKWEVPSRITRDRLVFSFVGEEADLRKFLNTFKNFGVIKSIGFKKFSPEGDGILTCLTAKQREVLRAAQKHGYYRRPRKISSARLAKILGISPATTLEHIRKAEQRIMDYIFIGY